MCKICCMFVVNTESNTAAPLSTKACLKHYICEGQSYLSGGQCLKAERGGRGVNRVM